MDYTEARTIFITPGPGEKPAPRVPDTPGRRLRDAAEPIATMYIWGPQVNERHTRLGLDFLSGYMWSRVAPMGEPCAPVVVAAFGVFEAGWVTDLYERARRTASRDAVLAAREEGTVASLRAILPDADVGWAVEVLRRATDVAATDLAGRPLFAGLVSLPWPADPLGQLWHATNMLREYRGDVHVAANVAAGVSGVQMNLLTEYWVGWEPSAYAGTRGWSPEELAAANAALERQGLLAGGRFTDAGQRFRDAIEEQTDVAMQPLFDAIGPDLPELTRQLEEWSARIVAAGAAPPDPYKRVSG